MTYVRRCIKCFQPWDGGGHVVCAHCRQIEAINEQTEALRRSQSSAVPSPYQYYGEGRDITPEELAQTVAEVTAMHEKAMRNSYIELAIMAVVLCSLPWLIGVAWRFIWGL